MRLCDTNAVLTEQVVEAERDHDSASADSSTVVVRIGQYQDQHTTLLEACGGIIDMLSPMRLSMEECLGNVPRWFTKVIQQMVHRGAALALAANTL